MKYYLQSHVLGFNRLFDSLEEVGEYIWAQTRAEYFDMGFVKEHLKTNIKYSYTGWGIDVTIYRRDAKQEPMPTARQESSNNLHQ